MTKIVFLDIDGVLNSAETWSQVGGLYACHGPGYEAICPTLAARLSRLLREARACIVLSSSWRYQNVRKNAKMLHALGVRGRVVGYTRRLEGRLDSGLWIARERWREVQEWLDRRGPELGVESFVILDDIEDFGPLQSRLVCIDARVGLTESDAARALNLLRA